MKLGRGSGVEQHVGKDCVEGSGGLHAEGVDRVAGRQDLRPDGVGAYTRKKPRNWNSTVRGEQVLEKPDQLLTFADVFWRFREGGRRSKQLCGVRTGVQVYEREAGSESSRVRGRG